MPKGSHQRKGSDGGEESSKKLREKTKNSARAIVIPFGNIAREWFKQGKTGKAQQHFSAPSGLAMPTFCPVTLANFQGLITERTRNMTSQIQPI
jgi:hypothetical protein